MVPVVVVDGVAWCWWGNVFFGDLIDILVKVKVS